MGSGSQRNSKSNLVIQNQSESRVISKLHELMHVFVVLIHFVD